MIIRGLKLVDNLTSISGISLLVDTPFKAFWTSYDPLDLASDSIDPLGFARGYLALADRFLPSFTTVTTIPRYVSMMCAALSITQSHFSAKTKTLSQKERQDRLKLVKSFERAWAIACGLASTNPNIGQKAVQGLRGIRYVNRRIEAILEKEKYIKTSSFNLLSNQVRYGGVGVYSVFLEECHLGSMSNFELKPLGKKLAEAFPTPAPEIPLWNEDAKLEIKALKEWGEMAHIGAFSRKEGKILAEALQGGEEADHPDNVRWATLKMLSQLNNEFLENKGEHLQINEGDQLQRMANDIKDDKFKHLKISEHCLGQIKSTLEILEHFEKFYQSLIFIFDLIRGAASDELEPSIHDLARQSTIKKTNKIILEFANKLKNSLIVANQFHTKTASEIGTVFRDSGILSLADDLLARQSDCSGMIRTIISRHEQVQSGKYDKDSPKAPWIKLTENNKVQLNAQRHQLAASSRRENWEDISRHPYRTHSALSFINACGI